MEQMEALMTFLASTLTSCSTAAPARGGGLGDDVCRSGLTSRMRRTFREQVESIGKLGVDNVVCAFDSKANYGKTIDPT